jgi:hypothetical protein
MPLHQFLPTPRHSRRRRMYIVGAIFSGVYGFVYFALLDTMSPALIFIAVALSLLPVMTLYGPQAALIAESFAPRLRYSWSGISARLDRCRRSCAIRGDRAARRLWERLHGRDVHTCLLCDQHCLRDATPGSYQQRSRGGTPRHLITRPAQAAAASIAQASDCSRRSRNHPSDGAEWVRTCQCPGP